MQNKYYNFTQLIKHFLFTQINRHSHCGKGGFDECESGFVEDGDGGA